MSDDMPSPPAGDDHDGAPNAPAAPAPVSGSPTDFLKGVVGKRVSVRLTSGVDYKGAPPPSIPNTA
jgi:U6 snRNA-associated Sm-like protein LSm6